MYTQVAEQWLENEPRMTPLQRSFLEKALGYYQDFAREAGTGSRGPDRGGPRLPPGGDIRRKLGEYPSTRPRTSAAEISRPAWSRTTPIIPNIGSTSQRPPTTSGGC